MSTVNETLNLPDPDIIEQIDAEALIQARRKRLIELNPDYQDVLALESEPLNINIEAESYREALLRLRINESVKANLLAFATGGDLDHLGDFYGLPVLMAKPMKVIVSVSGSGPRLPVPLAVLHITAAARLKRHHWRFAMFVLIHLKAGWSGFRFWSAMVSIWMKRWQKLNRR